MVDPSLVTIRRRSGPRRLLLLTLVLSGVAHLSVGLFLGTHFRLPELDIEIQIPIDVELGLTESVEAAPEPVAPPEPIAPPAPKPVKRPGAHDAGLPDAAIADAGVIADAGEDAEAGLAADAASAEAGQEAGSRVALADAGPPGSRLPPGALIALRVDMARIRQSPVAEDVRLLLSAVPDWQALLDGSQIDPVTQLERLLIATPNLQREKVVVAGRYIGGREVVDRAVQNLAQARGTEAHWRQRRGLPVAPWANADATERVIALVGPAHFTISREEDLDRVLAIAAARAARPTRGKQPAEAAGSAADALLAMEDQEGLSLEVDGVEQFVRRGRRGIPQRARLSAAEVMGPNLELRGRLSYADDTAASDALSYWQEKREAYARNALVSVLGLASVLQDAELRQNGSELELKLHLSITQTRLVLGYVAGLLGAKAPP